MKGVQLGDSVMDTRQTGVALMAVSAIVFSSAGTFTKGVEAAAWTVIFWRGLAASMFTLGYLGWRGAVLDEVRQLKGPGVAVTLMWAAGTAAFIPAFKLSSVANVALVFGAAPFIAAAGAWIFLREVPAMRVVIASFAAFAGVVVVVSGSMGSSAWQGDLLALFMTCMMAGTMVIYRAYPATPAALPAALSSVVLLPIAMVAGDPMSVDATELPVLVAFGLVFALASVTQGEGARRLPASETALLSILELPLAPVLALLVLGAVPGHETVIGGGVIFLAVVYSQSDLAWFKLLFWRKKQ